jgi:RNA-directed DNA polymerase
MDRAKPYCIDKREVWEAYKQVKANQGTDGVDGQSIEDFDRDLSKNLYRIWNRMSSGSYFPPPVRRVDIPRACLAELLLRKRPLIWLPAVQHGSCDIHRQRIVVPCTRTAALHSRGQSIRKADPGFRAYPSQTGSERRCWRNPTARHSDGLRQDCPDGGQTTPGTDPGTGVSPGFLWISAREVST